MSYDGILKNCDFDVSKSATVTKFVATSKYSTSLSFDNLFMITVEQNIMIDSNCAMLQAVNVLTVNSHQSFFSKFLDELLSRK